MPLDPRIKHLNDCHGEDIYDNANEKLLPVKCQQQPLSACRLAEDKGLDDKKAEHRAARLQAYHR